MPTEVDEEITVCASPTLSLISRLTGALATLTDITGEETPDFADIMTGMDELDAILTELIEKESPPATAPDPS